jgi:hypothetical protein
VRTPEEGALDAYRGFVVAMSAARPSVTDRLSRALLARWPTGAVEAVLGEYVKRFGLGALGSASMPTRVMVAGEHFAFQVNGSAQRPAEPRVLSPVAVEVELVREGGAHRVEALRARADDEELLELSVNRLHVAD